jgi:very-short-patch-repair endonuclease
MKFRYLRKYQIDRFRVDFVVKNLRLVIEAERRLFHFNRDREDEENRIRGARDGNCSIATVQQK